MGRNRRKLTQPSIEKLVKEGRGQYERESYIPWILTYDLSSRGFKHRVRGNTIDRTHHLFSNNEWYYFLILDFSPTVTDIREQYPLLPIDETVAIAKDMGVQHPRNPNTGELVVITTDFLLNICEAGREFTLPRTFKPVTELQKKRTIIKLEIKRQYWLKREKGLGIVTDSQLPTTLCNNLEHLHGYKRSERLGTLSKGHVSNIRACFNADLARGSCSIVEVANDCDRALTLPEGSALVVFYHLLANHEWSVDLHRRLDTGSSLSSLLVRS